MKTVLTFILIQLCGALILAQFSAHFYSIPRLWILAPLWLPWLLFVVAVACACVAGEVKGRLL
jgi:hypothetical protein